MIRVGQIVGAFGIQGAVKVVPLTDFDDRFAPSASLLLAGESRRVEWSQRRPQGLILKLTGIDNRTVAEMHSGHYLEVTPAEARKLDDGRFYHHQLIGLQVSTAGGQALGQITDVLERPANDVWVASSGAVEQLIPATREAVLEVDLEAGRVVVADWLLSLEDA